MKKQKANFSKRVCYSNADRLNYDNQYFVVDVFRQEIIKFVKFWPFKMSRVLIGVV